MRLYVLTMIAKDWHEIFMKNKSLLLAAHVLHEPLCHHVIGTWSLFCTTIMQRKYLIDDILIRFEIKITHNIKSKYQGFYRVLSFYVNVKNSNKTQ